MIRPSRGAGLYPQGWTHWKWHFRVSGDIDWFLDVDTGPGHWTSNVLLRPRLDACRPASVVVSSGDWHRRGPACVFLRVGGHAAAHRNLLRIVLIACAATSSCCCWSCAPCGLNVFLRGPRWTPARLGSPRLFWPSKISCLFSRSCSACRGRAARCWRRR